MKKNESTVWLLLVLVVPLCGNTCTFRSTSNNGNLFIAVCVPSSPDCVDRDNLPQSDDGDSGADSTSDGGNSRITSRPTALVASSMVTTASLNGSGPPQFDLDSASLVNQAATGVAASEPVPALGQFSSAVLVSLVAISALWMLRKRDSLI
jgi:hypothetical protein